MKLFLKNWENHRLYYDHVRFLTFSFKVSQVGVSFSNCGIESIFLIQLLNDGALSDFHCRRISLWVINEAKVMPLLMFRNRDPTPTMEILSGESSITFLHLHDRTSEMFLKCSSMKGIMFRGEMSPSIFGNVEIMEVAGLHFHPSILNDQASHSFLKGEPLQLQRKL